VHRRCRQFERKQRAEARPCRRNGSRSDRSGGDRSRASRPGDRSNLVCHHIDAIDLAGFGLPGAARTLDKAVRKRVVIAQDVALEVAVFAPVARDSRKNAI